MHFSQRMIIIAVATMTIAAPTEVAVAHGYGIATNMMPPASRNLSGNWPVTITHSRFDNGTDCLTLSGTGDGGTASLLAGNTKYPFGSFIVRNNILLVNISEPLYGQNGSLLFVAPARHGNIGQGAFEDDRGGSGFDVGDLTFGSKNGC